MNYRALYHLPKSIQHVSSVCRIDKIGTTPIRLGTNSSLQGSLYRVNHTSPSLFFWGRGREFIAGNYAAVLLKLTYDIYTQGSGTTGK